MTTILRIDASARHARSLTRRLGDLFVAQWRAVEPSVDVVHRDLALTPPGFVTEPWIAAAFTPEDERDARASAELAESDALIAEVEAADLIVMATPMYNYGMPASLKAWFDQVVRIGKTFSFDLSRGDRPLEPILSGKSLVLLTAWGEFGFEPGGINADANHLTTHIATVSKYLGIEELRHIGIEYQEFGDYRFARSKAEADANVPVLAEALATAFAGRKAA